MTDPSIVLAADVPFPPKVEDFYLPSILPWDAQNSYWFTKITALVWISVAVLIVYFLVSYRKPKLVPTKKQWLAESIYGFVRNNISIEMIGPRGVRFAPYLTTVFSFILVMNLWGVIPVAQMIHQPRLAARAVRDLVVVARHDARVAVPLRRTDVEHEPADDAVATGR